MFGTSRNGSRGAFKIRPVSLDGRRRDRGPEAAPGEAAPVLGTATGPAVAAATEIVVRRPRVPCWLGVGTRRRFEDGTLAMAESEDVGLIAGDDRV